MHSTRTLRQASRTHTNPCPALSRHAGLSTPGLGRPVDRLHSCGPSRQPYPVVRSTAQTEPALLASDPPAGPQLAEADPVPGPSTYDDSDIVYEVPSEVHARNAVLRQQLKGQLVLAPLTRGGNLPFRKWCAALGADVTFSEMAFARELIRGNRVECARLVRADNEKCYGVQIATKTIVEGVAAAKLAAEAGASFLDINMGCPIYEATRRGMGSALLRKPRAIARLVAGIVAGSPIPVTVKVRIGQDDDHVNVVRVADLVSRTGAAALTVHGRTAEQRYRKPAEWSWVQQAQAAVSPDLLPVIGNGDALTHYEARARLEGSGAHAIMTGRGALIKPWLFAEFKEGKQWAPGPYERVGLYRQFVSLCKAHFGDDAMGRRKAWYFLPWHFSFFHRYRSLPQAVYEGPSLTHPLIATRKDTVDPLLGETLEGLVPLERLLRCESEAAHAEIAAALWDAPNDADAVTALEALAREQLQGWEEQVREKGPLDPARGGGQMAAEASGRGQRGGDRGSSDRSRGEQRTHDEEY